MPLVNKYKRGKVKKGKKSMGVKTGMSAVKKTRSQSGRGTLTRGTDGNMY